VHSGDPLNYIYYSFSSKDFKSIINCGSYMQCRVVNWERYKNVRWKIKLRSWNPKKSCNLCLTTTPFPFPERGPLVTFLPWPTDTKIQYWHNIYPSSGIRWFCTSVYNENYNNCGVPLPIFGTGTMLFKKDDVIKILCSTWLLLFIAFAQSNRNKWEHQWGSLKNLSLPQKQNKFK